MFQYSRQKRGASAEPLSVTLRGWCRSAMDFLICVYLLLMIVVMPLFFRDGYAMIATDKATFCRKTGIYILRVLTPLLLADLGMSMWVYLREGGKRPKKEILAEQLRRICKKLTMTDYFMGLYGVSLILSYLCSNYRENALWGAGNGWYMGFLPQLMLVTFYFFIAKCWKPRKKFLYLMFLVSAVIFLLGYLNRFDFYPIKMNMSNPSFISTIGNINWYCGYAVVVLFAGTAFVWQEAGMPWQKVLFWGYVFLGFGTLVTQGSLSGLATLGVILLVLLALSADSGKRMRGFWTVVLLLSMACLFTKLLRSAAPGRMNFEDEMSHLLTKGWLPVVMTIISTAMLAWIGCLIRRGTYPKRFFIITVRGIVTLVLCGLALLIILLIFNTICPGRLGELSKYPLLTFSDAWGSHRGVIWKAGVICFAEQDFLHKLVGVGPDAMAAYIYQDGSGNLVTMLTKEFMEAKLTNAHNEWLTVLVNTGIIGLIGFGGAMVTAVRTFLQKQGKATADRGDLEPLYCACGLSLWAYTINNIFSFQQTVNLTTMMIVLGMGMAFMREDAEMP